MIVRGFEHYQTLLIEGENMDCLESVFSINPNVRASLFVLHSDLSHMCQTGL